MTDNTASVTAAAASEPNSGAVPIANPAPTGGSVTNAANATAHGPEIEADFEDEAISADDASDRATSIASSSTSLASSILQHRLENGRTYHKYRDGKYLYPNDERESERLDLQHNIYLLTLNHKLGLAPPNKKDSGVKRVLDVGTGTGIWAMDFAEEHPEAEVLGVDLTPVQLKFVPPNVTFEVDDVEQPWTYNKPFDYIHIRAMTSSISDWRKFIKQTYDALAPGGYIELFEGHLRAQSDDGSLRPDHAQSKWVDKLEEACKILGQPFLDVPGLIPMIEEIGFTDVTVVPFKWPAGPWPKDPHYKELGLWAQENLTEGLEAWTMAALTRALGWSPMEVQVFLAEVRKEMKDRSIHHYWPL
ncbi:Secondary metabolism regulator LAE1 [Colletotrichum sidae]|uniref:Secondary metabolism regulator LAE1 n=1 Tax=Colletotrichum sidae TaxID=1347389 RepID=A0A4R8T648_9PEZI|nr:Secondary metabolism regulator LAE1 [Colletotrichum sidae]